MEALLKRRPRLQRDVVDPGVVGPAAAVAGDGVVVVGHVRREALRDQDGVFLSTAAPGWPRSAASPPSSAGRSDGGVVGNPEVTDLRRRLEVIERAGDLLGLDERVGAVQEQHVPVKTVISVWNLHRDTDRRDDRIRARGPHLNPTSAVGSSSRARSTARSSPRGRSPTQRDSPPESCIHSSSSFAARTSSSSSSECPANAPYSTAYARTPGGTPQASMSTTLPRSRNAPRPRSGHPGVAAVADRRAT